MKILTIGRGENCHIVYDNPLVSRQHAILIIHPSGKMEIKDQSTNGTSINGAPIRKEKPYKVTRKDVVTFAGVAQLDWKQVPDPLKPYKIAGLCCLAVLVVWGAVSLIPRPAPDDESHQVVTVSTEQPVVDPNETPAEPEDIGKQVDSLKQDRQKKLEAERKKAEDKARIEKAKRDSIAAEKKRQEEEKKKEEERRKAEEAKKQEKPDTTVNRIPLL